MADKQGPGPKYGATPGRLILIAVLAVVLGVVVYHNFIATPRGTAVASAAPSAARRRSVTGKRETEQHSQAVEKVFVNRTPWPKVRVAHIAAFDPLALPRKFPQLHQASPNNPQQLATSREAQSAAEHEARQQLQQFQQQGVQVILRDGDQYIAVIGEKSLRVGDQLGKFRIMAITPQGVTLSAD